MPFFSYQRSPFTLKQTLNKERKKSTKFIEKKVLPSYHHYLHQVSPQVTLQSSFSLESIEQR